MLPAQQLDALEKPEVAEIIHNVMKFQRFDPVKTDDEVEQRMTEYFQICEANTIRPGIETLCLYLGITRVTLFNWCHGIRQSKRRQQLALAAKQTVLSYIESATLSGRLNPASSCFLLKNWGNYKDQLTVEAIPVNNDPEATKTPEEIAAQIENDIPLDSEPEPVEIIDGTEV